MINVINNIRYIMNDVKCIINEFIDKQSIIFLVIKIYEKLFKKNMFIKNKIEYIKNKEMSNEYLNNIYFINYCNHCVKIINAEMYCYKDKYYCSEECRSNYYE